MFVDTLGCIFVTASVRGKNHQQGILIDYRCERTNKAVKYKIFMTVT